MRILIADTTPLARLAALGEDTLDLLFRSGAEVMVTDLVQKALNRDPEAPEDLRLLDTVRLWASWNGDRIAVQPTPVGAEYDKALANWGLAGHPPALRPLFPGASDDDILNLIDAARQAKADGGPVAVLTEDDAVGRTFSHLGEDAVSAMSVADFLHWVALNAEMGPAPGAHAH